MYKPSDPEIDPRLAAKLVELDDQLDDAVRTIVSLVVVVVVVLVLNAIALHRVMELKRELRAMRSVAVGVTVDRGVDGNSQAEPGDNSAGQEFAPEFPFVEDLVKNGGFSRGFSMDRFDFTEFGGGQGRVVFPQP